MINLLTPTAARGVSKKKCQNKNQGGQIKCTKSVNPV